jgi:integrase/recombinase XerD
VRYVCHVPRIFSAERAISPHDRSTQFVIVDEHFEIHREASAYLAWLRALDRSSNTERAYAGRLARFLTFCESMRLNWRDLSVDDLSSYLKSIAAEPIRARSRAPELPSRFPTNKTANAHITAVCEFLRFGATRNWINSSIVNDLAHPKYLSYAPKGYDCGEDQQYRQIRKRSIALREFDLAPEVLSEEEIATLLAVLRNQRDRFLVMLLSESGIRIGEALGLRREDMHLLSSSASLGCRIHGPHIHVRHRVNSNGAAAKSRSPRAIPVTQNLVLEYAEYLNDRAHLSSDLTSDFVFVNVKRPPLEAPMRYQNAKKMFERASREVGFTVRPHMLRHTAATRWLAGGTPRDVVQALMGHVSLQSMEVYSHPSEADKRKAVERIESARAES